MNSAKIVMRGLGNLEDKDPPFKVQPPRIEVDFLECGDLSPLCYCCHIPEAKRRPVAALQKRWRYARRRVAAAMVGSTLVRTSAAINRSLIPA